MTKTNNYQKIKEYVNLNSIVYEEKLNTFHKCLIIDGSTLNHYYYVSLSNYRTNARTVVMDITFDIENTFGELCKIEYRISYNQLIKQLGDQ